MKSLSKACAVPLFFFPAFITTSVFAADPTSSLNDPIEITDGENYPNIVGSDVNIEDSDKAWISNVDSTLGGSWNSVNFSTSNNKIINNVSEDSLASTEINLKNTSVLSNTVNNKFAYGFYNRNGQVEITSQNSLSFTTTNSYAGTTYGIFNVNNVINDDYKTYADELNASIVQANSNLTIKTDGDFSLTAKNSSKNKFAEVYGIRTSLANYLSLSGDNSSYDKNLDTSIEADSISITSSVDELGTTYGIYAESFPKEPGYISGVNNINLKSVNNDIKIISNNGSVIRINGTTENFTNVTLNSGKDNILTFGRLNGGKRSDETGLYVENGKIELIAENGKNRIEDIGNESTNGIFVGSGEVYIKGQENFIKIKGEGIRTQEYITSASDKNKGKYSNTTKIIATDADNVLSSGETSLFIKENTAIEFEAESGRNVITAYDSNYSNLDDSKNNRVIYSEGGRISLVAGKENFIAPNNYVQGENNLLNLAALHATNNEQSSDEQIYLSAHTNTLLGSVIAENSAKIRIVGTENRINSGSWHDIDASSAKEAYSYAVTTRNNQNNSSAIVINALNNGFNEIKVSITPEDLKNEHQLASELVAERTVYAADKGTITINGTSNISTASWVEENAEGYKYNSTSMALVAAATENADDFVDDPNSLTDEERSHINLNYGKGSAITGDIVSGYGGNIQITEQEAVSTLSARAAEHAMTIRGNVLAGNGGKLNLELGEGSIWYGRADDYQDAGDDHGSGENGSSSFYNPAFSNKITSSGTVDVKLDTNATWKMLGQSWLTSLENNGIVDLSDEFISNSTGSEVSVANTHALTVQELKGNGTFVMSLDHTNHGMSDMLYAKNATGTYTLQLKEMPKGWESIDTDNVLRFATLKGGATFNPEVEVVNQGAQNYKLLIESRPYDVNDEENVEYNGDGGLTLDKPGQDNVDVFFELTQDEGDVTATASLAKANEENVENIAGEANDQTASDINNFVISQAVSAGLSDIGRTILNLSRANYSNAVYMDTLNKRQGEARFSSGNDNGIWVRMRHDNIGKDDSFRSHNTMLELGYDIKNSFDGGQWHTGIALDYMNGQNDYHNISGDGDIQRYGAWLYSTWLSDSGHYADIVLKYGHLKNDFDIYTPEGYNVTGDYSNDVVSISGEYGYKFSSAAGWFAEPQVQLQYSYVSDADYTTSQGTKVEVDAIDSLIARAGVRLGKDFNTEYPISLYLRGDVLHEFLGDQDLSAMDESRIDVTYENDDTWYSAGVGLSVMTSQNTYFFIEGEQVFGADNDNTYTLSGGFRHNF